MESNLLSKEFKARNKKVSKHSKVLSLNQSKKQVHKFRVNVKFLRGILQIINLLDIDSETIKQIKKSYRKTYRILGEIRESQINTKLAKEYLLDKTSLKNYREDLKINNQINKAKIKKHLKRNGISNEGAVQEAFTVLKQEDIHSVEAKVEQFIYDKTDQIRKQLNDLSEEESLHEIRKDLKMIKAVYKSIHSESDEDWQQFSEELLMAEVSIGNWHDKVVLRDSLQKFLKAHKKHQMYIDNAVALLEAENLMFIEELPLVLENFMNCVTDMKNKKPAE